MIYAFYTKDTVKINEIIKYIEDNYGTVAAETANIDYSNGSDQGKYYTFIETDIEIDATVLANALVLGNVKKLEGNSFYGSVQVYTNKLEDYIPLLERILEAKAKEYFFDSSVDACSYTTSDNTEFRKESLAFVAWRDELWGPVFEKLKADLLEEEVSFDDFISALPTYESYLALQV
jgi:hypothetical protein